MQGANGQLLVCLASCLVCIRDGTLSRCVSGCHSQNVGASILTQIGLADLIATNEDEFVRIAVELSNNPERLQRIKNTLRKTCLGKDSRFARFQMLLSF